MARKPQPIATVPRSHVEHANEVGLVVVASSHAGVVSVPARRGATLTVGRTPDCELLVDDESVSRTHARITIGETTATIEDLGSTNGVVVGGRRLGAGERVELALGEPCAVGSATVYVLATPTAATAAVRAPASVPGGPIVRDAAMARIYALLDVFAPSPLSVLILGETGTGKEVFADAIHRRSDRSDKPFLKLNCTTLAESLLEAELFGYEKGAFTGASQAKPGLFESANGGTVMLDEVGDLPAATQTKLLRVLETGDVMRIGSVKPITVDVRFISATHVDLRARIAEGKFRADLFFRIDGISVVLPPLRERAADLEPLAAMFAARVSAKLERPPPAISDAARAMLLAHPWPGNVRELRNVIDRAVVLCAGRPAITPDHLASLAAPAPASAPAAAVPLQAELERVERDRIVRALDEAAGNQTRAAKLLGMSRHALIDRLDRYGLSRPRKK